MAENGKHIIFDLFGVLLTSSFPSSCDELSRLLGKPAEEIKPVYERWEKPFDLGQITEDVFWHKVQAELKTNVANWQTLNEAVLQRYRPIPGAFELLTACSRKTDVYLLSNTRREWFERLDAKFALSGRFRRTFLSYKIRLAKPDEAIFEFVMSELGRGAQQLIFIDDRAENITAAQRLGIESIQFQSADKTRKLLGELRGHR